MALGSGGASNARAAQLKFIADIDRNALRRTLRGFGELDKGVDQFARSEIEAARAANQLTRSGAEQKASVSRLAHEFTDLRGEMLQAANAADKLDNSLDQAARQRKFARPTRGGSSLRADIGGIGDIETGTRAIGGGLGAAGFRQAEIGVAIASEIPASIEAIGQLKQALGKDLKLAFDSLKNAIGGAGLGLIGATVALVAVYTLASRATAKAKQALAEELEAKNEFARIVRTQTREQIQERLNEIAIEQEIAEAQRARAANSLTLAKIQTDAQGTLVEGAIRLGDLLNISDAPLDALKIEYDRTNEAARLLTIEQKNLTKAMDEQSALLQARGVTAEARASDEFVDAIRELLKRRNLELGQEVQQFTDAEIRAMNPQGAEVDAALERIIQQRSAEQVAADAQAKSIELLRVQRERENEAVAQAASKRDFNRASEAARQAERDKEGGQDFNIAKKAAESFAKIQDQIEKIQQATSEKVAAIRTRLDEQRVEAQRKFAEDFATAQRQFAERRLKIQETFQDSWFKIQRQFNRSNLTAVAERDALAAHNAAISAADQQDDAKRQRDRSTREQARAERERNIILRQSLERQLRTQLQAANRQIRTAIQSAQGQVAILNQQKRAEAAIMAQFAVQGVRSVQQFVAGALGALGSLGGGRTSKGTKTPVKNVTAINRVVDQRIEKTFGKAGVKTFSR